MRNITRLLSCLSLTLACALLMAANADAQDAKILKLVPADGQATVTTAGGQSSPATVQMIVPRNAEIATGAVDVYLEVVPGIVATIKPNSKVAVSSLSATEPQLDLRSGSVISQLDKNRLKTQGVHYGVKTAHGVAAARGTAFTVTDAASGMTIATTADSVTFTPQGGSSVTIQAGRVTFTDTAGNQQTMALADAVQTHAEIATVLSEAVGAVSTVVHDNLGSMSPQSATDIVAQVVAVAAAAIPSQATTFTDLAIKAVTAPGSSTAGTPDSTAIAAAAVTAAAIKAVPDQAAQIAGAAAAAAPAQAGAITAAAQAVAPQSSEAIVQQVSTSTGQSTTSVQDSATRSSGLANQGVSAANDALNNVVSPSTPSAPAAPAGNTTTETSQQSTTPPVDPSQNVSPGGG